MLMASSKVSDFTERNIVSAPWLAHSTDRQFGLCRNRRFRLFHSMGPAIDQLHVEIVRFYEYMTPTMRENELRESVASKYMAMISLMRAVEHVDAVGSYSTRLCFPTSDIDLVVLVKSGEEDGFLEGLENYLINENDVPKNCIHLINARVKIIRIKDPKSGISVDNRGMSVSVESFFTEIPPNLEYLRFYPDVKYILFVVKHILAESNLNRPYRGGLGSYAIFLMVTHFMMREYGPVFQSLLNLGEVLLRFLDFYGNRFDHSAYKLEFVERQGAVFSVSDCVNQHLSIRDPIDSLNDVGNCSFKYNEVKSKLAWTSKRLLDQIYAFDNNQFSVLASVVEVTNWMEYERRRKLKDDCPENDSCE
ncbi:hypothetical protein ACOME3_000049 [Neoechinorhynchus agilis]